MKVLLDECVPWPLHRGLAGHDCTTAQRQGWAPGSPELNEARRRGPENIRFPPGAGPDRGASRHLKVTLFRACRELREYCFPEVVEVANCLVLGFAWPCARIRAALLSWFYS